MAAHRVWRGIACARDDAVDRLLVVVATHSAPMRAFLATTRSESYGR